MTVTFTPAGHDLAGDLMAAIVKANRAGVSTGEVFDVLSWSVGTVLAVTSTDASQLEAGVTNITDGIAERARTHFLEQHAGKRA